MIQSVYLAGPIRDCTQEEAYGWREKVHSQLHNLGYTANNLSGDFVRIFDPMQFEFKMDKKISPDEWAKLIVETDLNVINKCSVVLANMWKYGAGTCMEIMHAHRHGVPVITVFNQAEDPWLRFHSMKIVSTLDQGIQEMIKQLKLFIEHA